LLSRATKFIWCGNICISKLVWCTVPRGRNDQRGLKPLVLGRFNALVLSELSDDVARWLGILDFI